jgi:hypothetical protein
LNKEEFAGFIINNVIVKAQHGELKVETMEGKGRSNLQHSYTCPIVNENQEDSHIDVFIGRHH